ncbi:DUF5801 repeats-in-toxin domain-containing protein [uncultured Roseibium sp.]|uniref:T1SS-143 repeat domain-containing protein n=1 Tax=uncultured Roseibium sp. TaxID=1936171 RepID=UPI0026275B52|nr:DUF5801 repeats-in-toxin domain-containing protein [uncultured Roseibium sp.]
MNEFVRIAQATPSAATDSASAIAEGNGPLLIERPLAQQSIVMLKGADQLVDFRQILDETISFFRIDGDLQMIFADGGMIIIQDFFSGESVADLLIVGDEEFLSLDDFISLANLQVADEIQTAAGDTSNLATALGSPQSSGQTFEPTDIGSLGDGLGVADLLVGEGPTERGFIVDDFSDAEENTSPDIGTPVDSTLDEQNLPEGTDPNNPVSATASLDVFFGDNAGGDVRLEFDGLPSGLTSDGDALVFGVTSNADGGQTLTATKSGSGELVFTVTLNVTGVGASLGGQYTFDLFGNLDHVADGQGDIIPLVFGFNAIDANGDTDSDVFTVNIIDDQPEGGESEQASFDEQALSNGTDPGSSALVASGALNILWGADNADSASDGAAQDTPGGTGNRSVVFAAVQPTSTKATTSDGVTLDFELSENDTVLTAYKGDGRLDADKIFEVSLFDDDTGSYTFELFGNIDHENGQTDPWILDFAALASDGDGDIVRTDFSVEIVDDEPEAGDAVQRTVQEHDLKNGTDPDPSALTKTGDLNIVWGADDADAANDGEFQDTPGGPGNRSVVFAAIADQPTQTTTSGGEALNYVLSQNGTVLTAYRGAGRMDADKVFEVSLSDDGTGFYTFELLGNIDHNPPGSNGQMVAWNLDFAFVAADGDGDTATGEFRVTVVDDEPLAGTAEQSTVAEHDLPTGTDPDAVALVQSGELNVIWGADDADTDDVDTDDAGGVQDTPGVTGNRSITFAPIADQPTQETTSDGVTLEYVLSANDTVLTAYKGAGRLDADKVFEVSLSDDGTGSYSFELLGNIDHTSGQTESWDLDFTFVASDSDGDTVQGDFRVTVADDAPITGEADLGVVEEEELEGGLDDPFPFDLDGAASQAGTPLTNRFSGSLNIVWGADDNDTADSDLNGLPVQDDATGADQRSVIFSDVADGLIADPASIVSVLDGSGDTVDLTSLTSRGDALSFVLSGDGTQLTAYAEYGQAGERSVFRVALSDDDSGSYTFILDDVLDHPIQDTTPFDEDALSLSFNYLAEDSDGDRAAGSFEVLAIDDGPLFRTDDIHTIDSLVPVAFTETADLRIPADGTSGTIFSNIEVTTPGTILDVNVSLEVQHSFSGDLLVFLVHPDGTEIRLIQDSFERTQPVDGVVSFDDDAATSIGTGNTNIVGTWLPDSSLNLDFYEGRDQLGVWTLQVTDANGGDVGQLVSWTLDIQTGVSAVVDEDDLSTQRGGGIDDNVDGNNDQATGDNSTITNALLDGDSDPTTVFGNLGVLWGADNENSVENGGASAGIGDRAVTFIEGAGGTIESLEALGLTSNGDALSYSLNAATDLLTATAGGRVVFTVELFDTDTGSFKFDLQDALDHPSGEAENDIILNISFVATDSDGDTGTSTFSVAVDDDLPIIGDDADVGEISEGANSPITGNLDISWGADAGDAGTDGTTQDTPSGTGNRSVVFAAIADQPTQATTSDGVALEYVLSENDTVLTAYQGVGRLDADKVFEVSLSDDGTGAFTFELLGNIDHVNGQTDTWDLDFAYVATDSDGDTIAAEFQVTVSDGAPIAGAADDVTVEESDLANGTDPDATALTQSGNLNITWGADDTDAGTDGTTQDTPGGTGNRSVVFAAIADQPTQATTSDGVALEYVLSENDTVLTAYQGAGRLDADKVFEVSLSDDGTGAYTFELFGNIDNVNGQTDTWNLDFAYVATDSDGDSVDGDLRVIVTDDEPLAGAADDATFEESDLANGTDPDATALTQSGNLNITWGADDTDAGTDGTTQDTPGGTGNRSVVFAAIADQPTQATTSDGVALEYVLSENDTVLTAYQGAGRLDADKVFEVSLSDDGTGAYTFELLGNIDHVNGQTDAWSLDFAYVASDSDGDTVSAEFRVTVGDDAPEIDLRVEDYVRIDETYGLHSDNVFDPFTGEYDPDVVALFEDVSQPGSDDDLIGPIYASYGVVGFDVNVGADDDADIDLSLRIDDAASGLTTTEGDAITLSLEDGLVVGRIANGDAVFAVHIDENGEVSIVQFQSLSHPDTSTSDEHITLDGKISAVLTVTDGDGDVVSEDVSIGADVTFDDDGPSAFRRGSGVTQNETAAGTIVSGQLQFDGGADGATVTGIDFISNGDYIRTIDPDASGGDRRGSLSADGQPIVWSSATDANGVITVTAVLEGTATTAFEIIINPDGSYTYQQFVGFDHPDENETGRDDQLTFRMRFTVTDGDGDPDTATAVFRVRDGGPEIGVVADALVEEDGVPALAGIDLAIDWGADDANDDGGIPGDRSVAFAEPVAEDTISFSDANGTLDELYSGGELVNFTFINGVLVGYTGAVPGGTTDSNVVLIAALSDVGTGSYDFLLVQPLDHTAPVGTDHYLDLSFAYAATDADGDVSETATFTVRVDAAGTVTPIDYSNLSTGVFVNLDDTARTYLGQTVAAETATDRDGVDPAVIGIDSVSGLDDAAGGTGNDVLVGNDNDNTLSGNDGDDVLVGRGGFNLLDGGSGSDTADYSDNEEGIVVRQDLGWATDASNLDSGLANLIQGINNNTIAHDDLVSVENINGSQFDDFLFGNNESNTLSGGDGDDDIFGLGGSDTLIGGEGNDELYAILGNNKLIGGAGQDLLVSGAGSDEFVFAAGEGSATAAGADRIQFYKDGLDTIVITGGLTFADLVIGDDGAGNAAIFETVNNQFVAVLTGISSAVLTSSDFSFSSDPIVLDLDGDGVELVSAEDGVAFDLNGDGQAEVSGWVGADDGILVMDLDGSGKIESGKEVFSEVFNEGGFADSLEALALLDSNGDGLIDASDEAFTDLRVWQDVNTDGVSQDGELSTLSDLGIESINLNAGQVYKTVSGNTVYAEGTYQTVDGSTGSYAGTAFNTLGGGEHDADETTRQSTAMAAGIALVLYSATAQEVEAGLSQIAVTGAPEHGEVSVSEDFTVTFNPAAGYEGADSVELALVYADGSVVTREVEIEVRADETTSTSEQATAAELPGASLDNETQTESLVASASADVAELGALVTGSVIRGDDGDNILVGTDGDDVLIGGLGIDTLTGGGGADTFVLNSLAEADIITDYSFADGDKIDLGELLEGAFATAANAGDFVRAEKQADGEVRLEVDLDGQGTAHDWQSAATLQEHGSMGETIRVVLDVEGSEAQIPVNVA